MIFQGVRTPCIPSGSAHAVCLCLLQEAKEREKRKKLEEERKRRMKEEEDRKRKEEEDERLKAQWEEEKLKKAQEEKKRMRVMSDRYDEDEMMDDDRHTRRTNPSPSKQHSTRREPPQPQPKPKSKPAPHRAPPPKATPSFNSGGEHTAFYEQALNDNDAYQNENVNLVNCFNCGRKFADDRIEKHEQFCKNLTKKRKVMDPTKTRTQGTELENYQRHRRPSPKVIFAFTRVRTGLKSA